MPGRGHSWRLHLSPPGTAQQRRRQQQVLAVRRQQQRSRHASRQPSRVNCPLNGAPDSRMVAFPDAEACRLGDVRPSRARASFIVSPSRARSPPAPPGSRSASRRLGKRDLEIRPPAARVLWQAQEVFVSSPETAPSQNADRGSITQQLHRRVTQHRPGRRRRAGGPEGQRPPRDSVADPRRSTAAPLRCRRRSPTGPQYLGILAQSARPVSE